MAASKRDMENVAKHVPFVEGTGRILISAGLCKSYACAHLMPS
jgi:hypothetical protein